MSSKNMKINSTVKAHLDKIGEIMVQVDVTQSYCHSLNKAVVTKKFTVGLDKTINEFLNQIIPKFGERLRRKIKTYNTTKKKDEKKSETKPKPKYIDAFPHPTYCTLSLNEKGPHLERNSQIKKIRRTEDLVTQLYLDHPIPMIIGYQTDLGKQYFERTIGETIDEKTNEVTKKTKREEICFSSLSQKLSFFPEGGLENLLKLIIKKMAGRGQFKDVSTIDPNHFGITLADDSRDCVDTLDDFRSRDIKKVWLVSREKPTVTILQTTNNTTTTASTMTTLNSNIQKDQQLVDEIKKSEIQSTTTLSVERQMKEIGTHSHQILKDLFIGDYHSFKQVLQQDNPKKFTRVIKMTKQDYTDTNLEFYYVGKASNLFSEGKTELHDIGSFEKWGELQNELTTKMLPNIDGWLKAGERVLVFCTQGISRSAVVVISYIMWKYKVSYKNAFAFAQTRRLQISPNDDDIQGLKASY